MDLTIQGPFSWIRTDQVPSMFEEPIGRQKGVYLWTVKLRDGELVYYVGETSRSFSKRLLEHLTAYLAGMYDIFDWDRFRSGEKIEIWKGMWRKGEELRMDDFLLRREGLALHLDGMVRGMRFFLCPLEVDDRMRLRIEAAIAQHLYSQPGLVGSFQDRGIQYKPRQEGERPSIVHINSSANLLGLPDSLEV